MCRQGLTQQQFQGGVPAQNSENVTVAVALPGRGGGRRTRRNGRLLARSYFGDVRAN